MFTKYFDYLTKLANKAPAEPEAFEFFIAMLTQNFEEIDHDAAKDIWFRWYFGLTDDFAVRHNSNGLPISIDALKALRETRTVYVLSGTDGFSIDTSKYATLEEAQKAMREAYNACAPDGFDDEDSDESFCGELNAILFTGETVYCWDITEVRV